LVSDYPVEGKSSYGLQPNFYYLSREQAKLGNRVVVISRLRDSQPRFERVGDVEVRRVENPFNLNAMKILRDLSQDYDKQTLVHTHSTSGVFLAALKKPLQLPMFAHIHGTSRSAHMPVSIIPNPAEGTSSYKMLYYFLREKAFWSSADRLLAVSDTLRKDLIEDYRIPDGKIRVVYNGVDSNLFKPSNQGVLPPTLERLKDKLIILYVGHFGPRKGLVYLIRAMKEIVKEIPDAVAVCIGGVPSWLGKVNYWQQLQNEIEKSKVEDKITLLDRVPNNELPSYYSSASVFVLPSYYEAFAKVILEAMACAVPIVVTREGGPQEAIEDGKSGLLVKYGSSKDIVSAVVSILHDQSRAKQMGLEARKRVELNFTWEAVAGRVNSAYDEVFKQIN